MVSYTPAMVRKAWREYGNEAKALNEQINLAWFKGWPRLAEEQGLKPLQIAVEQPKVQRMMIDQLGQVERLYYSRISGLRSELLAQIKGNQPMDVESVELRRNAIMRARAVKTPQEALTMLDDSIALQDHTMGHALARVSAGRMGWGEVDEVLHSHYGSTVDGIQALSQLETLDNDPTTKLFRQIIFSKGKFDGGLPVEIQE